MAPGKMAGHDARWVDKVLSVTLSCLAIDHLDDAIEDVIRSLRDHVVHKPEFMEGLRHALWGHRGESNWEILSGQIAAMKAFSLLGEHGAHEDVIEWLIGTLGHGKTRLKKDAARALGEFGAVVLTNGKALPALLLALDHCGWETKSACMEAIGKLGTTVLEHPEVVPSLLHFMHDDEYWIEQIRQGKPVPQPISKGFGGDKLVYVNRLRLTALEAVARLSPQILQDGRIATALQRCFSSSDSFATTKGRFPASRAIAKLGNSVVNHPHLVKFLVGDFPFKPLTPEREDAVRRFVRSGVRFFRQNDGVFAKTVAQLSQ